VLTIFPDGVFVLFFLFWLVVAVGSFVLLIVVIIDIAKRPDWQWKMAGQEKILWLLLVILVNFLAIPSLIYWFSIRKKLIAVEAAAASGRYGQGQMTYSGWQPVAAPISPPGWHPDPYGQPVLRWWDGYRWTEQTHGRDSPQ